MWIIDMFRKVVNWLLPAKQIESKMEVKTAVSGIMQNSISLWVQMYNGLPPWKGGKNDVKCLNLPATICSEFSRLILTEWEFEITGSEMADFINEEVKKVTSVTDLATHVEHWCAFGGLCFKPFPNDQDEDGKVSGISIDVLQADDCYPVTFDSNGNVTAMIFMESKKEGKYLYTRLEYHRLDGTTYHVTNKAYRSEEIDNYKDDDTYEVRNRFDKEVPLTDVDEWAALDPEVVIENVTSPLFAYAKIPLANMVDKDSPLGASVFHRAAETIQLADEQFGRAIWEFVATEPAILADESVVDTDEMGNPIIPEGMDRVLKTFNVDDPTRKLFEVFSPQIRNESQYKGLNELLMIIEQQVGLAYGTLSKAPEIVRTATEIRMSKQRSFHAVGLMQNALLESLKLLVEAIHEYAVLYDIVPDGKIEVNCTWGDGVLEDTDIEYTRRLALVNAGILKPEKLIAWYFGVSEEEALKMMPDNEPSAMFPEEE